MRALEVSKFRSTIRAAGSAAALLSLLSILSVAPAAAATKGLRLAPSTKDSSSLLDRATLQAKEAKKLEPVRGVGTMSPSACAPSTIACGTIVSGTLSNDDCPFGDGSFYDQWDFQATAGQTVQITMTAGYEPYLELHDPAGNRAAWGVAEEDGATTAELTHTLDATGTWTIWANSFQPGVTGPYSLDLQCTGGGPPPPPPPPPTCTGDANTLCLNGGRFRVQAIFSAPSLGIINAPARVVPLTTDTGYFWFFSSNNVEIVLKVVDGRAFNGNFWVFYGALSDVEYTITVTDTATGSQKIYRNTQGHLASVADVAAFPGGAGATDISTKSAAIADLAGAQSREISHLMASSASLACLSDATTLCLNNGRFQVRAIFSAPSLGITNAPARAVALTSDTGYFWFFSSNNVEIVIKAVDGRTFNNFFWVFYGALSDVEYTITVTDTVTGAVKTYPNTQGHLASVADVAAFQ
jgi:hypothetical protein